MYNIGQTVYFVAARKTPCGSCSNDTPRLTYTIEPARIIKKQTYWKGSWPSVSRCECEESCLCPTFPDYGVDPELNEDTYYHLNVDDLDIGPIPQSALSDTQRPLQNGLDDRCAQPVLLKNIKSDQDPVVRNIAYVASSLPND